MTSGLGRRPSRSTGPGDRHRAEHRARAVAHRRGQRGDAGLALGDAVRPAAAADVEQRAGREAGRREQPGDLLGGREGEQRVRGGAGGHRQPGADRHGVAQPAGALGGGDAHPGRRRRARRTGRSRRSRRAGSTRCRPARSARSAPPRPSSASAGPGAHAPSCGAPDQAVPLQRDGQPVRGRPGQAGAADELGERGRLVGHGAENGHRFVQDGDGVRLSHTAILASHMVRWP